MNTLNMCHITTGANFVELPFRPLEKIIMVLSFTPVLKQDHTHCQQCLAVKAPVCTLPIILHEGLVKRAIARDEAKYSIGPQDMPRVQYFP